MSTPISEGVLWRALLSALLLVACLTDLRSRRIPNALVCAVGVAGALRAVLSPSVPGLPDGLALAVVGGGLGLAMWLPLYAAGALGAGDVKLFAAAAVWVGPAAVPRTMLYVALAGGLVAVAFAAGGLRRSVAGVGRLAAPGGSPATPSVPYAIAIATGYTVTVWGLA